MTAWQINSADLLKEVMNYVSVLKRKTNLWNNFIMFLLLTENNSKVKKFVSNVLNNLLDVIKEKFPKRTSSPAV